MPVSPLAGATILVAHPGAELYGSDRVLFESVTGLIDAGAEVVVALPVTGPAVAELESRGARVVICPTPVLRKSALSPSGLVSLTGRMLAGGVRAARLMRSVRPEAVVVNTITIPVWLPVARAMRVPCLCHVHEAEKSAPALIRRALYSPLATATRVIANSRYSLAVLKEAVPLRIPPSAIVANGVAVPDGSEIVAGPRTRPGAGTAEDPVRLLFIGRLSPRKGPQVALEAVERLRDAGTTVRLSLLGAVFQGYEWFESELRTWVAEHRLGDQVDFLGFRDDVWPVVAQADIIVVPSTRDEPFGDTAVEAMLARRPLVVAWTSGLREAADGYATARFFPPGDAAGLAAGVQDILEHWSEVSELTAADRRLALSRHAPAVYRQAFAGQVAAMLAEHG
ncbi:glycosyltransferase family 4 protein [Acidipropionibacterium thoenii]|uniref:glycosyltransferase family 4 protein n=1 Tax=Acidipropionibacterium thoenii TaxID=1751 RepID=UPI00040E66CD|nr:glycosyltransferase family 4 protein [Acidipropionibacterium thoenii]